MLKTLLKYEWKDTWGICSACNGIALALSIIGAVIIMMFDFSDVASDSEMTALASVCISFYIVIYVASIIGLAFVMRYFFFYRYYKNLFTDQGYLMHTLPVNTPDLIYSKLIIAVIWQYITGIVMSICVMVLFGAFIASIGELSPGDVYDAFQDLDLMEPEFLKGIPVLFSIVVGILVSPIIEILLMYMAVGIGQQSKKNRFFLSVLVLIGIYMGKRFVTSAISLPFQMVMMEEEYSIATINISAVVVALALVGLGFALFFINKYFLEKKLNLE